MTKIFCQILTQKIEDKMKKIKNHVIGSPSFFDEKDVDFDVNTADNANFDYVADNGFFVTIIIYLSMIMRSSNYFHLF